MKKILIFALILCSFIPLFSNDYIISPTEGNWGNYQSLVLDIPHDYEAFYSLAGENPLEFGLMYDGPVVLENEGDVTIDIVIVDENYEIVTDTSIDYTVVQYPTPEFIVLDELDPVLSINEEKELSIPEDISYALNNSETFFKGKKLSITDKMYFERYIPIVIDINNVFYKYIIKLGNTNQTESVFVESENLIKIKNWNYITFLNAKNVTYSLNNQSFMYTNTGTIFIDRSTDVLLEWKESNTDSDELYSIFLPKKPQILGIPTVPIVNTAINFYLSDSRFVFGKQQDDNSILGLSDIYIDTIYGDAYSFFENISIYYNGIKQGDLQASFIIDKIPPVNPVIYTDSKNLYSREDLIVKFSSTDPILYYIAEPKTSKTGFNASDIYNKTPVELINLANFSSLDTNSISFSNTSTFAQSYEIFAYSTDYAGNNSEVVSFKIILDPYNYYITQDFERTSTKKPLGTIDDPFIEIKDVNNLINKQSFQIFYLDGIFEIDSPIDILTHTTFNSTDSTRLIFNYGNTFSVKDSLLTLKGGTLEQSSNNSLNNENTFIKSINSILSIENCEVVLTGGENNNCVALDNSSLYIYNSGITVQSVGYGAGVLANNSSIVADSLRTIIVAETAIPISLVNSTCGVENSAFISNAQYSRSLESINSEFSLVNNMFVFDPIAKVSKPNISAIWFDEQSVMKKNEANTFAGFTELFLGDR